MAWAVEPEPSPISNVIMIIYTGEMTQISMGSSVSFIKGDSISPFLFTDSLSSLINFSRLKKQCAAVSSSSLTKPCAKSVVYMEKEVKLPNINSYVKALMNVGVLNIQISVQNPKPFIVEADSFKKAILENAKKK
jgi:hypothetical protein